MRVTVNHHHYHHFPPGCLTGAEAILEALQEGFSKMATQADVDALVGQMNEISTSLDGVAGDVTELKRLLEEANQNPAVDLTAAIDLAASIKQRVTDLDASTPAPGA